MKAHSERGTAVILALMTVVILATLGAGLVLTTSTEPVIGANFRDSVQTRFAARAIADRALLDLATLPSWDTAFNGTTPSAFADGPPSGTRSIIGGTVDQGGSSTHRVNFTATAPGTYRLDVAVNRVGMVQRNDDLIGCNGQANTGTASGSVAVGPGLASGGLNTNGITVGNGGGNNQQTMTGSGAFANSATASCGRPSARASTPDTAVTSGLSGAAVAARSSCCFAAARLLCLICSCTSASRGNTVLE